LNLRERLLRGPNQLIDFVGSPIFTRADFVIFAVETHIDRSER
jgi:hypothetical protein